VPAAAPGRERQRQQGCVWPSAVGGVTQRGGHDAHACGPPGHGARRAWVRGVAGRTLHVVVASGAAAEGVRRGGSDRRGRHASAGRQAARGRAGARAAAAAQGRAQRRGSPAVVAHSLRGRGSVRVSAGLALWAFPSYALRHGARAPRTPPAPAQPPQGRRNPPRCAPRACQAAARRAWGRCLLAVFGGLSARRGHARPGRPSSATAAAPALLRQACRAPRSPWARRAASWRTRRARSARASRRTPRRTPRTPSGDPWPRAAWHGSGSAAARCGAKGVQEGVVGARADCGAPARGGLTRHRARGRFRSACRPRHARRAGTRRSAARRTRRRQHRRASQARVVASVSQSNQAAQRSVGCWPRCSLARRSAAARARSSRAAAAAALLAALLAARKPQRRRTAAHRRNRKSPSPRAARVLRAGRLRRAARPADERSTSALTAPLRLSSLQRLRGDT
jgi:hypothetical protein